MAFAHLNLIANLPAQMFSVGAPSAGACAIRSRLRCSLVPSGNFGGLP